MVLCFVLRYCARHLLAKHDMNYRYDSYLGTVGKGVYSSSRLVGY